MQGFGSADHYENSLEITAYAPADFPDSEMTRPPESYLDSGSQSPATIYSSTIQNTLQRHIRDVRDRFCPPVSYSNNWKKKIRDVFIRGNENVLGFLTKPISNHPTLGQTEQLIRRFSRQDPPQGQSQLILRDLVKDISGVDTTAEILERLQAKQQENTLVTLNEQVHEIYELYRETLEKIAEKDILLKQKITTLDKIQPRLVMLLDLGVNETTSDLQNNIEKYLETVYESNNPEQEYKELLILYKKFYTLRDAVNLLRLSASSDREPICGICLNDSVTYALVPCGHTYCDQCSKRQMMQCYMCRQNSSQRVKLFFT